VANQSQDRCGHIYLVHAEGSGSRYKIGLAKLGRLNERVKELNRGQAPYPLKLIHSIKVRDRFKAEKYLHDYFANYRSHGEWFQFSDSHIRQVVAVYDSVERQLAIPVPAPSPVYQATYSPSYTYDDNFGCIMVAIFIGAIVVFIAGLGNQKWKLPKISTQNGGIAIPKTSGIIRVPGGDAARLRTTPNLNGQVIKVLPDGTRVVLGKLSDDGQWQQIRTQDGKSGWVWAEFVQ
jgi:Meiotically up-regulated gene 113/Bacterial SH3 domain